MGYLAVFLLVIGVGMKLFAGKIHFDRRNEYGIEEYGSYTSAVATSAFTTTISIFGGILVLIGLITGVVSCVTPGKPQGGAKDLKPVKSAMATSMISEYRTSNLRFDSKYRDKVVRVSGLVTNKVVKKDSFLEKLGASGEATIFMGGRMVSAKNAGLGHEVQCRLDKRSMAEVDKVSVGRSITLQGFYIGNLRINDCQIM